MTLTDEQIKEIGDYYFDDLPFQYGDIDQTKFFNHLPHHLQCEAMQWGANDTCVRENIYEHLLENQLGLTVDQWYDKNDDGYTHELAEALFGKGESIMIELDYDKLKEE